MTEEQTPKTISLCRKTTCCPQLIIEGDQYIITDDYGGKVTLSEEHMRELIFQYKVTKPLDIFDMSLAFLKALIEDTEERVLNGLELVNFTFKDLKKPIEKKLKR